jgi:hypothetical protein
MIEITAAQSDRINLILGGIKNGAPKAFSSIIGRGLQTTRTVALKEITKVYTISKEDVRAESNIKIHTPRKDNGGVIGEITYAGATIPLVRFDITPETPTVGKRSTGVYARQMKNSGKELFKHAFISEMRSGHIGMFERVKGEYMNSRKGENEHSQKIGYNGTKKSYDQFYGSSVSQMIENIRVRLPIEKKVQETIDKRVEHEITRILNGYGGSK